MYKYILHLHTTTAGLILKFKFKKKSIEFAQYKLFKLLVIFLILAKLNFLFIWPAGLFHTVKINNNIIIANQGEKNLGVKCFQKKV